MDKLEIDALVGEIAKRHGVLLDRDDPVFVAVTLNELVLGRVLSEIEEQRHKLESEFALALANSLDTVTATSGNAVTAATQRFAAGLSEEIARLVQGEHETARAVLGRAEASLDAARRALGRTALALGAVAAFLLTLMLGHLLTQ